MPWNTQKTPTKHVLRLFERFLKIRFSAEKSGSRLRFGTMLKYLETLRKHQQNMFWGFLKNFGNPVLGSKIRFSAQMSNNAKILWNTQKTPTKHAFRHFKNFFKIRFLAEKSGSRLRCRIMLKNTMKHPENTTSTCFDSQQLTSNGEMSWTTYTVCNFADDLHWPELGILLESIDYHFLEASVRIP